LLSSISYYSKGLIISPFLCLKLGMSREFFG
jgi:hypothetical protein